MSHKKRPQPPLPDARYWQVVREQIATGSLVTRHAVKPAQGTDVSVAGKEERPDNGWVIWHSFY